MNKERLGNTLIVGVLGYLVAIFYSWYSLESISNFIGLWTFMFFRTTLFIISKKHIYKEGAIIMRLMFVGIFSATYFFLFFIFGIENILLLLAILGGIWIGFFADIIEEVLSSIGDIIKIVFSIIFNFKFLVIALLTTIVILLLNRF